MLMKLKHLWVVILLVALVAATASGIGIVAAQDSNGGEVITACIQKNNGMLRIVEDCEECRKSEECRSWGGCDCEDLLEQYAALEARVLVLELEGEPCNDGNECTQNDHYVDGVCISEPAPEGTSCDDDHGRCDGTGNCEQCPPGEVNCGGQCVDRDSDISNCGSCGNQCSSYHGTPSCTSGECSISCEEGWGDCDPTPGTGCETYLWGDISNCGSCENMCPDVFGADSYCLLGECTFFCYPPCYDCDGDPSNGCEINISDDTDNCGACGNVCDPDLNCVAGECIAVCSEEFPDGRCPVPEFYPRYGKLIP